MLITGVRILLTTVGGLVKLLRAGGQSISNPYLYLHPSLENSTNHITIVQGGTVSACCQDEIEIINLD